MSSKIPKVFYLKLLLIKLFSTIAGNSNGSSSASQRIWCMQDVITKVILTQKWDAGDQSPLTKSYANVEEFLQAIIQDQDPYKKLLETLDLRKCTDLFYLIPYQKGLRQNPPYDLNVLRIWAEDSNFGDDIKLAIISDGVDATHPDLITNYDHKIAHGYALSESNVQGREGTRAAGLITMKLEGALCGIGIAPKAKLTGIPLMRDDKQINLKDFAAVLKYLSEDGNVDVVLSTWIQNYPKHLLSDDQLEIYEAYREAANKGRQGKGLIHVVSIGPHVNQGLIRVNKSTCARNVILNSIYTIGVASTEYDGSKSQKSGACAAVMVTAYSTDGKANPNYKMRTTNDNGSCTDQYKNTEAAASLVAGIIALALKAK